VRRHPPLLGEHNSEILAELGMSAEAIDALEAGGAFTP
jgi:formyl-CoA transferase